MTMDRLSLAWAERPPAPAEAQAKLAIINPPSDLDLALFDEDPTLLCFDAARAAFFEGKGIDVVQTPPASAGRAIVFLPRAKLLAHAWVEMALRITGGGPVLIDGQKTDGIDSILRGAKAMGDIRASVSKSHGKAFWLTAPPAQFAPWAEPAPKAVTPELNTRIGVFSADAVDPASALLAEQLPNNLYGHVVDLGAGWGYLSNEILKRGAVTQLDLVELDWRALECAKANIKDKRASFHWADATSWRANRHADFVIMNPPFHSGRAADLDLGRGFIQTAARLLGAKGQLYMVANRHLPYEECLQQHFGKSQQIFATSKFKILHACAPKKRA